MKTSLAKTTLILLICAVLSGRHISGAAPADETDRAEKLLKQSYALSMRGRTLKADIVLISMQDGHTLTTTGKVRAMKPYEGEWHGNVRPNEPENPRILGDLEMSTPESKWKDRWIADGHQVIESLEGRKEYLERNEDAFQSQVGFPFACFFSPPTYDLLKSPRYIGKEQVDGVSYDVVQASQSDSTGHDDVYTLYFGASGLLEGYRTRFPHPIDHKEVSFSAWMKHVVVDSPMKASEFVWAVPAGFSRFDPNAIERALLPVGALAPDFLLTRSGGGQLKLADARRKKRAVLVNFWFEACGPCRAEFPHLEKLYERLQSKGLEVIAINQGDTAPQVQKYLQEGKFTFPAALGGPKDADGSVYRRFGVQAFPTNYLLDANGKVVWRAMGYNDFASPEFKHALKQVGLE